MNNSLFQNSYLGRNFPICDTFYASTLLKTSGTVVFYYIISMTYLVYLTRTEVISDHIFDELISFEDSFYVGGLFVS